MAKKTTFEEFVERATKLHDGKYEYNRYDFEHPNEKGKIRFVCPRHGEFWQTIKNHLKGWGCRKCGREDMKQPRKKTTEQFVKEVKEIWGDKLIFDKVDYQGAHKKVIVICPEHGEFLIEPSGLLNGHGCPKCAHRDMGLRGRCSQEDVIKRIKEIHGDKYDLSRFVYVKTDVKAIVGCKKHGWFEITPNALLQGNGCRECGFERMKEANSLGREEFFMRCREIHKEKYTYNEDSYINTNSPIKVICPIHGEYEQGAREHMEGHGCPKCAAQERGLQSRITFEEFEERARKVHGNKYILHKDTYTTTHEKTKITCPIHGDFWQSPYSHMKGQGCPKCAQDNLGLDRRSKQENVVKRIKEIHGDKYDLSRFVYVKSNVKAIVGCKKHGWFEITPSALLRGVGCRKCGFEKSGQSVTIGKEEFFKRCREIHGDRYIYNEDSYTNTSSKIKIICPVHGEFEQNAADHARGCGCQRCANEKNAEIKKVPFEEFVKRAEAVHGDKYVYHKDYYNIFTEKTLITCKKHGDFWQSAYLHTIGQGCPKCSIHVSNAETEIFDHIKNILGDDKVRNRDKETIKPYELDIHIPSMKVAIEYDGLIWHSDKFHKDEQQNMKQLKKTLLCEEKGIRLIHVFEDEYLNNKELVLEKIDHILGIDKDKPKIMARKCSVMEIPSERAEVFLNRYHIQGFSRSTVYLGCYHNDELVGVMSFKQESKDGDKWELTRFASNNNYICSGVAGKLFKYFTRHYNFSVIKSFADRRWSIDKPNNLYRSLGFELDAYTRPDYRYVVNGKERVHKFNFRKDRIAKKYGLDRNLTERELTEQIGVYRIYDCGLIRYIYRKRK